MRDSGRPGAPAFCPSPPAAIPQLPRDYSSGTGGTARTCPTAAGLRASSRRPAPQRRQPSGSPAPSRSQAGPPAPRYLAAEPPLLLRAGDPGHAPGGGRPTATAGSARTRRSLRLRPHPPPSLPRASGQRAAPPVPNHHLGTRRSPTAHARLFRLRARPSGTRSPPAERALAPTARVRSVAFVPRI